MKFTADDKVYFQVLFSLAGILVKQDGEITENEVYYTFDALCKFYKLNEDSLPFIKKYFELGMNSDDIDSNPKIVRIFEQFNEKYENQIEKKKCLLQSLYEVGYSDGELDSRENSFIEDIFRRMGGKTEEDKKEDSFDDILDLLFEEGEQEDQLNRSPHFENLRFFKEEDLWALFNDPDSALNKAYIESKYIINSKERASLLANAIRLSEELSPKFNRIFESVKDKLNVDFPVEVFIFESSIINASAIPTFDDKKPSMILLSNTIFESFDDNELAFVIGHELGHLIFEHTKPKLLEGSDFDFDLIMSTFSRAAEISADRMGFLACGENADATRNALFKLICPLKDKNVNVDPQILVRQFDDLSNSDLSENYLSSHPLIAIRIKAINHLEKFLKSNNLKSADLSKVNELIWEDLSKMEPDWDLIIEKKASQNFLKLLACTGAYIIRIDNEINEAEMKLFSDITEGIMEGYLKSLAEADFLIQEYNKYTAWANQFLNKEAKLKLLHFLILLVCADSEVNSTEIDVYRKVAEDLEVPEKDAVDFFYSVCENKSGNSPI